MRECRAKHSFPYRKRNKLALLFHWFGSAEKSSLKIEIVLQKSKGAGNFYTDFAPIFFHARIIISNLQLSH